MSTPVIDLLDSVAQSVRALREALNQPTLIGLEGELARTQQALDDLNHFPGGPHGLRAEINTLDEAGQKQANQLIQQASSDHEVSSELLVLAIQRNAVLQSYIAQTSDEATYASDGGFQMHGGGQLLGKI